MDTERNHNGLIDSSKGLTLKLLVNTVIIIVSGVTVIKDNVIKSCGYIGWVFLI